MGNRLALLSLALLPGIAAAQAPPHDPLTVAFFGALQEQGPSTAEELAARGRAGSAAPEAIAADATLNEWKLCVLDALQRWRELHEGPGTLVDGAFGRCGDIERVYRGHLLRITQDGRPVMDLQFARSMIHSLEDAWRPRLTAAALDQELAERQAAEK